MIPMFKSNGGFTLVELIVVIAILGILATIAVPAYSSYVEKAQAKKALYQAEINEQSESLAALDQYLN